MTRLDKGHNELSGPALAPGYRGSWITAAALSVLGAPVLAVRTPAGNAALDAPRLSLPHLL